MTEQEAESRDTRSPAQTSTRKELDPLDINPPDTGTAAASQYYKAAYETWRFIDFVVDTVFVMDESARKLSKIAGVKDSGNVEKKGDRISRKEFLLRNSQLMMQMFLARLVDNFQTYIVEVIRSVLVKRPEILTSKDRQLSLEYAFQFTTMEELKADLVENKVNDLSYQGLSDLREWCEGRGIPLVIRDDDLPLLAEAIETRNVITHNRGVVGRKYLRHFPGRNWSFGSPRELDPHEVNQVLALLNRVVRLTDSAVVDKFALSVVEIAPPAVVPPAEVASSSP